MLAFGGSRATCVREEPRDPTSGVLPLRERALDMPPRQSNTDRKSTRLNSSHANISYAVFCLKKKIPYIVLIYYLASRCLAQHRSLLPVHVFRRQNGPRLTFLC